MLEGKERNGKNRKPRHKSNLGSRIISGITAASIGLGAMGIGNEAQSQAKPSPKPKNVVEKVLPKIPSFDISTAINSAMVETGTSKKMAESIFSQLNNVAIKEDDKRKFFENELGRANINDNTLIREWSNFKESVGWAKLDSLTHLHFISRLFSPLSNPNENTFFDENYLNQIRKRIVLENILSLNSSDIKADLRNNLQTQLKTIASLNPVWYTTFITKYSQEYGVPSVATDSLEIAFAKRRDMERPLKINYALWQYEIIKHISTTSKLPNAEKDLFMFMKSLAKTLHPYLLLTQKSLISSSSIELGFGSYEIESLDANFFNLIDTVYKFLLNDPEIAKSLDLNPGSSLNYINFANAAKMFAQNLQSQNLLPNEVNIRKIILEYKNSLELLKSIPVLDPSDKIIIFANNEKTNPKYNNDTKSFFRFFSTDLTKDVSNIVGSDKIKIHRVLTSENRKAFLNMVQIKIIEGGPDAVMVFVGHGLDSSPKENINEPYILLGKDSYITARELATMIINTIPVKDKKGNILENIKPIRIAFDGCLLGRAPVLFKEIYEAESMKRQKDYKQPLPPVIFATSTEYGELGFTTFDANQEKKTYHSQFLEKLLLKSKTWYNFLFNQSDVKVSNPTIWLINFPDSKGKSISMQLGSYTVPDTYSPNTSPTSIG